MTTRAQRANTPEEAESPGDSPLRAVLRWLYVPWAWLFVIPFFGVSTIILGTIAIAVSKVLGPRVGFHCGTLWAWLTLTTNLTRVTVSGREHLDPTQSYVIMVNHQSHFDIVSIYGTWRRQFRWVMRAGLRSVPGLGWGCESIGHVFIDRSNREAAIASLDEAAKKLAGGVSILFFPEGTRSRDGRMRAFKKGGFMLALDMGLPILPVSISGSYRILPHGTWRPLPGRVHLTIHPPIAVEAYGSARRDDLMRDTRAAIGSSLSAWERGA